MKNILNRILLAIAFIALVFFAWFFSSTSMKNPFAITSSETKHNMVLEEVRSLGNLELASFYFKDIVDQKLTRDYLPDPRALLIVYGEAVGCLNLAEVKEADVDVKMDSVFVHLPPPVLCHYKIDHSKSSVYDTKNAFMNEALLFEEAYKSAEKQLKEEALRAGILNTTKENAEHLLKPLLENLTQKNVVLVYKD
ncbi:DUF4230 domain-containing protein [Marinilongibacter aquaticus]|uniref:DUF4230 domain-containing protein n=1 Tax=Marinilongibacter aquaticus TaxID=2975157 RepID=UPI0021BD4544|nr:DUF4230 domain-containing protein [Marinilongibacter aquaticus]UBM57867.1 DUF4230 domain-containing protein [Marinilongibacter aquaticus]